MTRVIGFAGWSGAGKTQLLTGLIPVLKARGLTVSTLKHAHHTFDIDVPGKDSYRHREAGASEVLIASASRWALMHELNGAPEPELPELLAHMSPVDLVLIEGFKRNPHIKIEVHREANGKSWLYPDDPSIGAIASDVAPPAGCALPWVSLNDYAGIADLVQAHAWPLTQVTRPG
ncbi:molybdopterin-guanine dinucleotide biosynthesis protein B [Pseudomonadota bacterium AL_CKDN230030165-1A_HGKHYDSX7]